MLLLFRCERRNNEMHNYFLHLFNSSSSRFSAAHHFANVLTSDSELFKFSIYFSGSLAKLESIKKNIVQVYATVMQENVVWMMC